MDKQEHPEHIDENVQEPINNPEGVFEEDDEGATLEYNPKRTPGEERIEQVVVPSPQEAKADAEKNILGKYVAPISIVATATVTILEAFGIDVLSADDVTTIILAILIVISAIISLYGVYKNNDYTTRAKRRTKVADQVLPKDETRQSDLRKGGE